MFKQFIIGLIAEAAKNEDIQKFADDLVDKLIAKFRTDILPDLIKAATALLPTFGGALLKSFMDRVPELPNIDDLAGATSDIAQNILEQDPDLPFVSDTVEQLTGIDASELLKNILGPFLKPR